MKTLNAFLSLSAFAASVLLATSISAQAANYTKRCQQMGLSLAECSCQRALESGSQRAIRLFLRQYPFSDTACNAKNSTASRPATGDGHEDINPYRKGER